MVKPKGFWHWVEIVSLISALIGILVGCQVSYTPPPSPTPPAHTVSTPYTPSGPSNARAGDTLTFVTGGATCSQGHPVEYRFDWGDGTYSAWSPQPSATKTYSTPGTYLVRAQARCSVDPSVTSGWSAALSVTITPRDPCAGVTGYTPKYYTWRYQLTTQTLRCYIPNYLICRSQHADELAGIPRNGPFPYAGVWQLVNWPEDDTFLRDLVKAINSGLTDYYEIATNTLHFVEALMPYTREVGDYWQTPVETLYLQTGDCEDGAILYVALLRALGYPVYFGSYLALTKDGWVGHVFAWVEVAKSWVDWCESRPNKCRDLLGCWTIAVVNGKYYAMAETTVDPSIESWGYWGLGCGCIPPGAQSYIIFPPGEGTTAQPATILSCPCSN